MNPNPILPLFPLNTVLFPGQLLPLHIFETRYRVMIQECIVKSQSFGVVLIREGKEVGDTADPYEVGTTTRIHQIDKLPDGRMNLVCIGEERIRINQTFTDRPFLTGLVEYWPWDKSPSVELKPLQEDLYQTLVKYLRRLSNLSGSPIQLENLPDEPLPLACLAAIALRISNSEKQELLSTVFVRDLMGETIRLLRRENQALQITEGIPSLTDPLDSSIYLN